MKYMGKNISMMLSTFALSTLALLGCTTGPDPDRMEEKVDNKLEQLDKQMDTDIEKSRVELTADLRGLRSDIEGYIIRTDEKLGQKDLKAEERTRLEEKRALYNQQLARIDLAVSDVGMATRETWVKVDTDTRSIVDELEAWWKLEKEGFDLATEADADKDGH
jgi:hypothetical protein